MNPLAGGKTQSKLKAEYPTSSAFNIKLLVLQFTLNTILSLHSHLKKDGTSVFHLSYAPKCLIYSDQFKESCELCEEGAILSPSTQNSLAIRLGESDSHKIIYESPILICKPCPAGCKKCSKNSCSVCKEGFFQVPISYTQQRITIYDCSNCNKACQICDVSFKQCTNCKKGFTLDKNICKKDTIFTDQVRLLLILFSCGIFILAILLSIAFCFKKKRNSSPSSNAGNSYVSTNRHALYRDTLIEQAVFNLAAQMKATKQFKIEKRDLDPEELKNTENILDNDSDMRLDHYKADIVGIGHDRILDSYYSIILNFDQVNDQSRESGFLGSANRESHQISKELIESLCRSSS